MIPRPFLEEWARLIASDDLHHYASTRYRFPDWRARLTLPLDFTWLDAGFSAAKLSYLAKKYPVDALPHDGCIESLDRGLTSTVTYRRVDLVKGWMGDVLYLQRLGYVGDVEFTCPGIASTLHAVRLSCVFPAIVSAGLYRGVHRLLSKTLRRAIVHRLERRYDSYGQAKRANAWAHRLSSEDEMRAAINLLREVG